ncbi:MAG: hypothetical protein FJY10_01390 [Bacteroidetes bacterium]|nr:hypothetical protein [Bacteroidota bacterium]
MHQVTEEIDAGAVVGQSPPTNVRNTSGKIPGNCLIVYDKLSEPLCRLTVAMVEELVNRYERGEKGLLAHADLIARYTPEEKAKLMQPITATIPMEVFPEVDNSVFDY